MSVTSVWLGNLPCFVFFSVRDLLLASSLALIGLSAERANRLFRLPQEFSLLLLDMLPMQGAVEARSAAEAQGKLRSVY